MTYQSHSPQVYHYLSREGPLTSIEARVPFYHQSPLASFKVIRSIDNYAPYPPSASLKNFGQSRVEAVYESHHTQEQRTANQLRLNQDPQVQALSIQNPMPSSSSTPISRLSNGNGEGGNVGGDRFQKYLVSESNFRYNIFSVFDKPWNECMRGQKCGSLPSNECIANSTAK